MPPFIHPSISMHLSMHPSLLFKSIHLGQCLLASIHPSIICPSVLPYVHLSHAVFVHIYPSHAVLIHIIHPSINQSTNQPSIYPTIPASIHPSLLCSYCSHISARFIFPRTDSFMHYVCYCPLVGSRARCVEASSSLPLPDVWHLHRLRERERLITLNPAMPLIIEQTVNKLMIFLTVIGEVAEG